MLKIELPREFPVAHSGEEERLSEIHRKIGALTRQLHDSLSELGYTEKLKSSVGEMPDMKSRLCYIAKLTGNAAEKVLNLVDESQGAAKRMMDLVQFKAPGLVDEFKPHQDTLNTHLSDIMMAQDFHDLTGQVIARVVALTSVLEGHLVELLIQTSPTGKIDFTAPALRTGDLSGPSGFSQDNPGVVSDQSQVDDLLASLGF